MALPETWFQSQSMVAKPTIFRRNRVSFDNFPNQVGDRQLFTAVFFCVYAVDLPLFTTI
jgi:hypothetical protein